MKLEVYLGRALPVFGILAALGPGLQVVKLIRGREAVKAIRQFGPLPEIQIPAADYLTLTLATLLLIAAVLQLFRFRVAAPLALAASAGLWVYYIPGIWDEVTGSMWFAVKLGRTTGITWQMLTYQIAAMICAGILTYLRARQPQP